jgi:hypothetical protein
MMPIFYLVMLLLTARSHMAIWNGILNYELIKEWKDVILGILTYASQHLYVGSEENHEN